jgi:hypothetical protein
VTTVVIVVTIAYVVAVAAVMWAIRYPVTRKRRRRLVLVDWPDTVTGEDVRSTYEEWFGCPREEEPCAISRSSAAAN